MGKIYAEIIQYNNMVLTTCACAVCAMCALHGLAHIRAHLPHSFVVVVFGDVLLRTQNQIICLHVNLFRIQI